MDVSFFIFGAIGIVFIGVLLYQGYTTRKKWKSGELDVPPSMERRYEWRYGKRDVKKPEAEPPKEQRSSISSSVGGDVSGEMVVAGRDVNVIQASPGELRTCPACGGAGRFERVENGERIVVLCQTCNGLGQIRL